jgi:hypothetical protein
MKPALLLNALTGAQRQVVAQLAAAFGLSPTDWPNSGALRECVEMLAVANTVEKMRHHPSSAWRSERRTWVRAAQLLDLVPSTLEQRRVRAQKQAAAERPTAPQADALSDPCPDGPRP